eukprot:SAG11_NODE_9773_length_881_cov_1.734015_2_plen_171_part_01
MIYHDALPQWWEAGAQKHIEARGFADRQWRHDGTPNAALAKRCFGKLFGDSPEMMPLDSSLFNDLIEAIGLNVVASAGAHSMATPNQAWETMTAVWAKAPTEARIIQDIDRVMKAIDAIIEKEGAYVEEWDARHGHRKATQQAVKGGALRIGKNGVLTAEAEAGGELEGAH